MGILKGVFTGHIGSPTGEAIQLIVPQYYGVTQATGYFGTYATVSALISAHPELLNDSDYTFITSTQGGVTKLNAWGITNIIDATEYTKASPLNIYISETSYINIFVSKGSLNIKYIYSDGIASNIVGPEDRPYGVLSFANGEIENESAGFIGSTGWTGSRLYTSYNNQNADIAQIRAFWSSYTPEPSNVDPYEQGGTSGTGGGTGTFDLSSDPVDFPALPTLTAVSTGLVSVYTPTIAQLNALATYMWNANPTDVDWWKKLVANPLDLILGLSIVPVAVPQGAAQNVKVGLIDTGISITKAASQFVEVDCGSIEVKEFYGAALDYLPFRKTSIYLPFIGTRTISTDDIMGKTVHVKYHVDLLSGACTAMVKCGDAVLYQYSGACAVSIPLSGETFTNMITSTIQLAASVAGTIASGGAAAGITAASAANSVMSMKPQIERAGGVSGAAGQLGIMKPYLIGEIPRQSVPENYNTFAGYPSNVKATLADLSGFTSIETVHLQGIPATSEEYAEIERLLKEGVIL